VLSRRRLANARAPTAESEGASQVDAVAAPKHIRVNEVRHCRMADVVRQAPQPHGLWKRQLQHRPLIEINLNPPLRVEEIGCGHLNTPPLMREDALSACRWRVNPLAAV
jgi:hypothetical protein